MLRESGYLLFSMKFLRFLQELSFLFRLLKTPAILAKLVLARAPKPSTQVLILPKAVFSTRCLKMVAVSCFVSGGSRPYS